MSVCSVCGEKVADPHLIRDEYYCEDCMNDTFSCCYNCGDYIDKDERICEDCSDTWSVCAGCDECVKYATEVDGDMYCDDCLSERFSYCEKCDSWVDCNDIRCVNDEWVCDNCFYRYCFTCEECGYDYFLDDNEYVREYGNYYCSDCYWDNHFVCDRCEEVYSNDDYAENGLCQGCYDETGENREIGDEVRSDTFERLGSTRKWGIEIETESGDYDSTPSEWGIKDDGSISGKELVSPIMNGDAGLEQIEELYREVRPTFSCCTGIHVHIDVRDLTGEQRLAVIRGFEFSKSRWWSYVDSSRHTNCHCRNDISSTKGFTDYTSYMAAKPYNRYTWVNLEAIAEHGTIEVRLLEGTKDVKKVVQWVTDLLMFVESVLTVQKVLV